MQLNDLLVAYIKGRPIPPNIDASGNLATINKGYPSFATAQATVTTAASIIVPTRAGRGGVMITNLGTTDVYIGTSGVTTTTGTILVGSKGSSINIPTTAAIYAIVGSGTQVVTYTEVF